jgi:hypothetical protein
MRKFGVYKEQLRLILINFTNVFKYFVSRISPVSTLNCYGLDDRNSIPSMERNSFPGDRMAAA